MGFIQIDPELQVAEEIADYFATLISNNQITFPKMSIPELLTAKARNGLDSDATSASAISRFREIGIPSGSLSNGSPNVMEAYTKMIIEEVFDAIQAFSRVDVAVDEGIVIQATGANGGGPIEVLGASVAPWTATGVMS